jgi:hypothetical protein
MGTNNWRREWDCEFARELILAPARTVTAPAATSSPPGGGLSNPLV